MEQNDCASCCKLSQRNRSLGTLIKLGMDVIDCYDEQVVLNKAMDTVLSAFKGKWCVLRLLDEKTGELTITANSGIPEIVKSMAMKVNPEGTLLGKVLASGVALGIENIDAENSKILPYYAGAIKSMLVAPLKISGKTVGTLKIYSSEPQQWSKDDYQFLTDMASQLGMALGNARNYNSMKKQYLSVIVALAAAMEARDSYTQGHSERVAKISLECADIIGISREQQEQLYQVATLHDIGKLGVPESIIMKHEPLSADEWEFIKMHPANGEKITEKAELSRQLSAVIRHHHERWDGGGYPDGLAGEEIPHLARIISVADAYDAMTTDRPYRLAKKHDAAIDEILFGKEKQFDPLVVEAFLQIPAERLAK